MFAFTSLSQDGPTAIRPKREKPSGRTVPYLFIHRNSPAFRIRIPADLQVCLGKTEYRRSLGRCYASEAKHRALKLATAAFEVFSFVREAVAARDRHLTKAGMTGNTSSGFGYTNHRVYREDIVVTQGEIPVNDGYTDALQGRTLSSLTDDEIRSIADAWLLQALKGTNLFRLHISQYRADLLGTSPTRKAKALLDLGIVKPGEVVVGNQSTSSADGPEGIAADDPALNDALIAQAKGEEETAGRIKEFFRNALRTQQVSKAASTVDTALAKHGVGIDPATENAHGIANGGSPSLPYRFACQEMLKAKVNFYSIMEQNAAGDYAGYDAVVQQLEEKQAAREKRRVRVDAPPRPECSTVSPASSVPAEASSVLGSAPGLTLSAALKRFFVEMKREGKWNARTQMKEPDKFYLFQAIVDPDDSLLVKSIGAEHMRRYKEMMFALPKDRTKSRKYKHMPLEEVIKMADNSLIPESDRFSPRTINNHFVQIATFINWLGMNEYNSNTAITGLLRMTKTKQDHENRDPYNRNDLTKIFAPENYLTAGLKLTKGKRKSRLTTDGGKRPQPDSGGKPSRFWMPLLALFTGARIEELAQLDLTDVLAVDREGQARIVFTPGEVQPLSTPELMAQMEQQQETLCLFIRRGEGQSIKNDSSRRYVPISPLLSQELDFLGYLASVHASYNEGTTRTRHRIFPELTKVSAKDSYANAVSNWYRRYRQAVGITKGVDGGRKDFHSFRDTMSYWCDQIGEVEEKPSARYLGHAYGTMTFGVYSKDTAPHILYTKITAPFTEYARSFLDVEELKASKWANFGCTKRSEVE